MTGTALLYCMACALRGENASGQRVIELCGGELSELLTLAKRHSVSALAASALTESGLPPEALQPWNEASNLAIRRAMLFDVERGEILSFLDASKIWRVGLKGVALQDLYPRYGQREMADNDILIDPDAWRTVRDWMLSRGYRQTSPSRRGKDISYVRAPAYHFEMHTQLFDPSVPLFHAYYRNVKERLRADAYNPYEFRFSDEDFYIYLFAHAYHHFTYKGAGFRTLSDAYAYRRARGAGMNWDYVRRELALLGLTDFEERVVRLSETLFACPAETAERARTLSADDRAMLDYLEGSGTYGDASQAMTNLLRQLQPEGGRVTVATKCRYCLARLRIAARRYQKSASPCPGILYPFYLTGCLLRDAFRSRKYVLRDLRTLGRTKR